MYCKKLRSIAIDMYNDLKSYREVAKTLKIAHSTVYKWVNNNFENKKTRNSKVKKTQPIISSEIKYYLESNPYTRIKNIQKHINKKFKTKLSYYVIYCIVKNTNLSLKKSKTQYYSNIDRLNKLTNEFITQFKNLYNEETLIVSIDETYIDKNSNPTYAWSKIGEKKRIPKRVICNYKRKISICSAITSNGDKFHHSKYKAYNSETFLQFIKSLDLPTNSILLMDNASFHKASKSYIESKGWKLLFIPPYSPWFNPIENMFSVLKSLLYNGIFLCFIFYR